ncbi:uncharacterized protein LOC108669178, partial [Hyalella azteca]|uniref:Uncharacterized protein LOC108669178 n=1 Tax=Hyalella azteca TaxID=294128 RepID=A0A8B7NET3_HYAAZ
MADVFEVVSLITNGVCHMCGPNCYDLLDQERLYWRVSEMIEEGQRDDQIIEVLTSELIVYVLAQKEDGCNFAEMDEANILKTIHFGVAEEVTQDNPNELQRDEPMVQPSLHHDVQDHCLQGLFNETVENHEDPIKEFQNNCDTQDQASHADQLFNSNVINNSGEKDNISSSMSDDAPLVLNFVISDMATHKEATEELEHKHQAALKNNFSLDKCTPEVDGMAADDGMECTSAEIEQGLVSGYNKNQSVSIVDPTGGSSTEFHLKSSEAVHNSDKQINSSGENNSHSNIQIASNLVGRASPEERLEDDVEDSGCGTSVSIDDEDKMSSGEGEDSLLCDSLCISELPSDSNSSPKRRNLGPKRETSSAHDHEQRNLTNSSTGENFESELAAESASSEGIVTVDLSGIIPHDDGIYEDTNASATAPNYNTEASTSVTKQETNFHIQGARPKQRINLEPKTRSPRKRSRLIPVWSEAPEVDSKRSKDVSEGNNATRASTSREVVSKITHNDQLLAAHLVLLIEHFPNLDTAYLTQRCHEVVLGRPLEDLIHELSSADSVNETADETNARWSATSMSSTASIRAVAAETVECRQEDDENIWEEMPEAYEDQLDQVEMDALFAHQVDFDENPSCSTTEQDVLLAHQIDMEESAPHKEVVNTLECCCCFDDKPVIEMLACDEQYDAPHFCCSECLKRYTENFIGEDKLEFPCLNSSCMAKMPDSAVSNVLEQTMFQKLLERRQAAEILAAELKDLESCPFCNYAAIIEEKVTVRSTANTVFRCDNIACGKRSC